MRFIKKAVEPLLFFLLRKFKLYSLFSLRKTGPLKEDGWFRSFEEQSSVDADGNPIPWITYPAIEFLSRRVTKGMVVFEYGCGGSTLWWASRVKEVYSVEHDSSWYAKIAPTVPDNVKLSHIELEYGGAYSKKVAEFSDKFDLIVVDGRDRVNCAMNCVAALKSTGVIIWDNCDQIEYADGVRSLLEQGFRKIEFRGLAPIVNWKAETGIFYRDGNCLGI